MFRRKKDDTDEPKFTPATDDLPPVEAMPKPFPRPAGGPSPSPFAGAAAKSPVAPVTAPPRATSSAAPRARGAPEHGETKKLIVGREIVLSGQITSCDRLVVEGKVEASLTDSHAIEIADIGFFKGTAEIDSAEIAGRFEGTITVRDRLFIRSTGQVQGKIRYGQIEIEPGGVISGDVQMVGGSSTNVRPIANGSASKDEPMTLSSSYVSGQAASS
jgi:cytoskeletal protein CcmA (bactofilin family)